MYVNEKLLQSFLNDVVTKIKKYSLNIPSGWLKVCISPTYKGFDLVVYTEYSVLDDTKVLKEELGKLRGNLAKSITTSRIFSKYAGYIEWRGVWSSSPQFSYEGAYSDFSVVYVSFSFNFGNKIEKYSGDIVKEYNLLKNDLHYYLSEYNKGTDSLVFYLEDRGTYCSIEDNENRELYCFNYNTMKIEFGSDSGSYPEDCEDLAPKVIALLECLSKIPLPLVRAVIDSGTEDFQSSNDTWYFYSYNSDGYILWPDAKRLHNICRIGCSLVSEAYRCDRVSRICSRELCSEDCYLFKGVKVDI